MNKRTQDRIKNNLGIIPGDRKVNYRKVRSDKLELFDQYLERRQYDKLLPWDAKGDGDSYVPIRKRRPLVNYNLASRIVNTVTAKLIGQTHFPKLRIEVDPNAEEFLRALMRVTNFRHRIVPAIRSMLGSGSSFCRFYSTGMRIKIESFNSKYCYPLFNSNGELELMDIRYTYPDPEDRDEKGNPKIKWYGLTLTTQSDILYDNPEYKENEQPNFKEVQRVDHELGFVQGTWFRTTEQRHTPDGVSLLEDVLDFIDSLNYSLSQSDQAASYAQEPQLGIKGMNVDEIDELIKSSTKAWNLGREGEAGYIEADLMGIEKAGELRDKIFQGVQHVARVIMLDPEKIVGSAQSAKAMEVLHGPLVDLVHELRPQIEEGIIELISKIAVVVLSSPEPLMSMPEGWQPKSMDITAMWQPVFPMTMLDLTQKMNVAASAASNSIISRESLTQWMAGDFGVENVQEEIAKIKAQPVINPFGSF